MTGTLVPLGLIVLFVVLGNSLVIAAIKASPKLSGPTHQLILSLAVADLLVGLLVLPMSALYEVLDIWIFSKHLCFIWLTVDVWTCTASIFNLVAISLDRYIAVTHPVTYHSIMTPGKYAYLSYVKQIQFKLLGQNFSLSSSGSSVFSSASHRFLAGTSVYFLW